MVVSIKPYADADYDEVWALHRKTIRENEGFAKNLSFHADFQNIRDVYDGFFVLRENAELVGMVAIKRDGEIKRLQVKKAHKRKGHGRRLMEHVMAYAVQRGMTRVHLDVSAPNKEALALYRALGFVVTRRQRVEYGPDREAFDMTFMEKELERG